MINRRQFLCTTSVAAGASTIALTAKEEGDVAPKDKKAFLAPACGLYCGICMDYVDGKCHGCGCKCGRCAGKWHIEHCGIAACAKKKGLESCADCADMPCTQLIQFTVDPIWRTHAPCIENLRRRKKIGTSAWLREQEAHWKDEGNRTKWLALYRECSRKSRQAKR